MIKFNTFIDLKENNSLENNLYEILTFTEYILKELQNSGEIELVHFQKWKNYINQYEAIKINLNLIENSMILEEIQKNKEKIMNLIGSMKEYEFISDYFKIVDNSYENEEISTKEIVEKLNQTEKFLKIKESIENHFDSQPIPRNIFQLLALSSNEYLKEKLNLDDEQIQNLKGKESEGIKDTDKEKDSNMEITKIIQEETPTLKTNQKLNKILKIKSDLSQKNKISSLISDRGQSSSKFDKEMEEEINNEIFSYTRNMKNYARNFGEIISTDNKKLTKIEKVQEKDKNLTDASIKKLNEFHYDLKIGLFKLIIMLIIVVAAFITTLMVIRIFPKFVK